MSSIPLSWLPKAQMFRFHGHWSAGGHKANSTDLQAYNFLWEGDGKAVRGVDVRKNEVNPATKRPYDGYAAHTLNANSGAIGGSMCGMMGATESPFRPGSAPLTLVQWNAFIRDGAQIIDHYGIPITKKTVLFHDEVPIHLGIAQRQKWDVSVLPFDMSVRGAVPIGDKMRDEMWSVLKGTTPKDPPVAHEPIPAGGTARVTSNSNLNLRRGPGTSHESRGLLPPGTILQILGPIDGDWVEVRTPAGYDGWVNRTFITMVDGPAPVEPTKPDPRRELIQQMRKALDDIEANLGELT